MIKNFFTKTWNQFINKIFDTLGGNQFILLNPKKEGISSQPFEIESFIKELTKLLKTIKSDMISVDGHLIDYQGLKESDSWIKIHQFYLPQLNSLDLTQLKTENQKKAFWINLYNIGAIAQVIHKNLFNANTEQQLTKFFFTSLYFFRQSGFQISNHLFSLDDIEHGILRSNSKTIGRFSPYFSSSDPRNKFVLRELDPRIHFALNCTGVSCPPILAYQAGNLDYQLNLATRNYISQETSINHATKKITTSKLFQWYKPDFDSVGGVNQFIQSYITPSEDIKNYKVGFASYSFELNNQQILK